MAVKDVIPIKYWIPKLDFAVRLGTSQYFKIMYKVYTDDWNTDTGWTTLREQYLIQPDGTTSESDKLVLTNLVENRTYVIRIVDSRNKNYNFKFKTGRNIALSDSPYYNKVLMPGQIYDWFINGLDKVGIPTIEECTFYYEMNAKKGVSIDTDNWGSIMNYITDDNGKYTPTSEDGNWKKVVDVHNTSAMGVYLNNTGDGNKRMVAFPALKFNGSTYETWHAYWMESGGGGISAQDVKDKGFDIGFYFLIESEVTGRPTDTVICGYDTSKTKNLSNELNDCWKLIFRNNGTTGYIGNQYTDETGAINTHVDTSFAINKDTWYYIKLSSGSATIYNFVDDAIISHNITLQSSTVSGVIFNNLIANVVTPFLFGDETTVGVVLCKAAGGIRNIDSFISKVCNPEKFTPKLRLVVTYDDSTTETVNQESKFTSVITAEKGSFLIDPDIISKLTKSNVITKVAASIIVNGDTFASKTFNGYTYKKATTNQMVTIEPLCRVANYLQESFELKFKDVDNPIEHLAQYFFTKHGTWGGYNGGVNGHNLYFNGEGNLVLENHGDKYTGTVRGVNKESDVSPYTGYGADVDYSANAWDIRTNKNYLRVGTALVSNNYFTYGRADVNLKLPIGCWGVCPAIWLFHYIEISESDYRYNLEPYVQRNAQGNGEDGYYRVVNNEIDIELPSQLTNGVLDSWDILPQCYFDMDVITTDLVIGVRNGSEADTGLFQLNNISNPKSKSSWTKVGPVIIPRYEPSFQNVKFNNWIGERETGSGWAAPVYENGVIKYTAEEVYKGKVDTDILKEEYHSQLLHLANNLNGYADGKFHKWSIVWLPSRTLLLVDDVVVSENRGFIPFNQMKLTIAGWFPTMPAVYTSTTDEEGNVTKTAIGVKDSDGIHVAAGGTLSRVDDTAEGSIGTWAGTRANWGICQMEVESVKWEKYNVGDEVNFNGTITRIDSEPMTLGESFPESGLRSLVAP